jgi:thiosulfate/3-mercaptopyruvate sulfurtransferase
MKSILTPLLFLVSGLVLPHEPTPDAATQDPTPEMVVSPGWLSRHLKDPLVRVIATGDRAPFDRGHVPGARFVAHEDTIGADHRLLAPDTLATVLARAGASDDARIVLYGDSPMTTGWLYMVLASIGHGDHVSMLDGNIDVWRADGHPVSADAPAAATARLTPKPVSDVIVTAPWVRERLEKPGVCLLDVRTDRERATGYLPGSTLVSWRDLFADPDRATFKSRDDIRARLANAGVKPGDHVVTYCAIGMRASLMYFAARYAGIPARVYVGSFDDWQRQPGYPVIRRH